MKRTILMLAIATVILAGFNQCKQKGNSKTDACEVLKGDYLGQTPPGDTPELFAPGIVSSGFHDMDITISPDLDEIFFSRSSPIDYFSSIIYLKRMSGKWSKPQLAPFISSATKRYIYPFISPDGKKIYFGSDIPISGINEQRVSNIWVSEQNEDGWGAAQPLAGVNTDNAEEFPSVSNSGAIYFYANYEDSRGGFDIYCCKFENGQYGEVQNLGENINSENNEFHAYIAPDESYIIFDRSTLPSGNFDLFISFKKEDGSWAEAINMGETINDPREAEIRPYVSPDGKYLFFSSTRNYREDLSDKPTYSSFMNRINSSGNSSQDIYWVSTKIIEELKPEE